MTAEIYTELIRTAEGPTYINLRTRIALCILAVTSIRINELLPLKVSQLKTLFKENWIAIDRSKRGSSNHKAFLTKEGKKIMHDRQKDFQLIFLMKEPDSYLFTAESNHYKPLDRVVITRDVNKVMRRFPINFLANLISLVIASGLDIEHSYGKIPKILNLLNKPLVIET
jgi:integrase